MSDMIIDDFYSHRFAYDKSEKIYILNNKINTFVANAICMIYLLTD